MDTREDMLVLMQDIKEMLWGIVLMLGGLALCAAGLLGILWGVPFLIGIIVCVAGIGYAHNGFTNHRVVEKKDAESKEDA